MSSRNPVKILKRNTQLVTSPYCANNTQGLRQAWDHLSERSADYQPLRLLVMQPTSFCNLDCLYCYLPDRNVSRRMSAETTDAVFDDLLKSPILGRSLTVVWHAGEPLVVGLPFYSRAVESSQRLRRLGCDVTHTIQTNATLINDAWCGFFKAHNIRLGVSIDGPAFLHDAHRKTRAGKGSHAQVMRGLELLQRHGIDFYAICVLTRESLEHAQEIYEFFTSIGVKRLCFNVEEVEGVHTRSFIGATDAEEAHRKFFAYIYDRLNSTDIQVREFQSLRDLIFSGQRLQSNFQCEPFAIISVGADGGFSAFSPELLSASHANYGRFIFGNINRESFTSMLNSDLFWRVHGEIQAGVKRCRESCQYFALCGGGAPSNKVFENGTFDSAETAYCRLTKKVLIDLCLNNLETEMGLE